MSVFQNQQQQQPQVAADNSSPLFSKQTVFSLLEEPQAPADSGTMSGVEEAHHELRKLQKRLLVELEINESGTKIQPLPSPSETTAVCFVADSSAELADFFGQSDLNSISNTHQDGSACCLSQPPTYGLANRSTTSPNTLVPNLLRAEEPFLKQPASSLVSLLSRHISISSLALQKRTFLSSAANSISLSLLETASLSSLSSGATAATAAPLPVDFDEIHPEVVELPPSVITVDSVLIHDDVDVDVDGCSSSSSSARDFAFSFTSGDLQTTAFEENSGDVVLVGSHPSKTSDHEDSFYDAVATSDPDVEAMLLLQVRNEASRGASATTTTPAASERREINAAAKNNTRSLRKTKEQANFDNSKKKKSKPAPPTAENPAGVVPSPAQAQKPAKDQSQPPLGLSKQKPQPAKLESSSNKVKSPVESASPQRTWLGRKASLVATKLKKIRKSPSKKSEGSSSSSSSSS